MICEACLREHEDARLDGVPLCLSCVGEVLAGRSRPTLVRLCSRCRGPVRGGRDDVVPVCRTCVEDELERAAAVELRPEWREEAPPLVERWRPRRYRPVLLEPAEEARQLEALRAQYRAGEALRPPARSWLDDD